MEESQKIAVIDLGTNTFHLLVARVWGKGFEIAFKEKVSVKIGQGGISKGFITEEGISRALNALKGFKTTIDKENITEVYATATSAIRSAKNGKDLVKLIKEQTGINVRIISGDEEAQLIYFGVKTALDLRSTPSLIIDIGGGSVEFIICNNDQIFWKRSYEIGAQRLVDFFHQQDPICPKEIKKLNAYLQKQLPSLDEAVKKYQPQTLIGSSGSFDTLSEIYRLKIGLEKDISDTELPLPIESFEPIFQEVLSKDKDERLQIPGMIAMRADMIVVACCLIHYIIEKFNIPELRVSSFALKEGVLYNILNSLKESFNNNHKK